MMKRDNRLLAIVSALVCGFLGGWLIWTGTQQGAGIGGDATIYITSARNLLAGRGLGLINPAGDFRLIPYFPPFYPLLLAFFGLFGWDPASSARVLNIALFALTVFLVSFHFSRISGKWLAGAIYGGLTALSPILIPAYSWAMSETLCMFLMMVGFIALERFLSQGRCGWLVLSALGCGLSFLTRYSSAACILAACLILLIFQSKKIKNRFWETFLFGVIAVLPMIIWLAYDIRMTDTVASRSVLESVSFQQEAVRFNGQMRDIVLQWFLPDSWATSGQIPFWALQLLYGMTLVFPLAVLLWIALIDRENEDPRVRSLNRYAQIFSLFFYCYVLVVMLVSLTTYPPITIGSRMLIPAHVSFLTLLAWTFARLGCCCRNRVWQKGMLAAALFGFALVYGMRSVRTARQNALDGLGYNAVRWKNSETIAYLRNQVPEDQTLVTNEETAVLYLLDRASWPMHEVYVTQPDPIYYSYEEGAIKDSDTGRRAFSDGRALLVVFDSFEDQMADIYGADTSRRIEALFRNLAIVTDTDDGVIYRLKE